MKNRIQNLQNHLNNSSNVQSMSSTSRHELKEIDKEINNNDSALSNIKVKFMIKELIKRVKYLAPPREMPFKIDE
jgi:hypothetical protein